MSEHESNRQENAPSRAELLEALATTTDDVWWLYDGDFTEIQFINDAYEEVWGRPISALKADGMDFLEGVHPDDREEVTDAIQRLTSGEPVHFDIRVNDAEDFGRWVSIRGEPIVDENGTVEGIAGFGHDVTERKQRERDLHRYETVIEHMDDVAFVIDQDRRLAYANTSALAYAEANLGEILGVPITRLTDEMLADPAPFGRALEEVFANDGEFPKTVVAELNLPDGRVVGEFRLSPMIDDGTVTGAVVISRDVTEREERERKLQRHRTLLESTQELASVGGYEIDLETGEFVWNSGVSEILETKNLADVTDLEGAIETLTHPEDRERLRQVVTETIAEGGSFEETFRVPSDGQVDQWLDMRAEVVEHDGDELIRGTFQDVTTHVRREEMLSELHTASRSMVRARTRDETIEEFLAAADSVLPVDGAGVLLFDEDENVLEPVSSIATDDDWPGIPTVEPGESVIWESFVDGESRVLENVMNDPLVDSPRPFNSIVVVPLADYGVFCGVGTEPSVFDERRLELVETLAANAEAVLTQADREQQLREQDDRLREQTERLKRLDTVNEQIRHVIRDLVGSSTRDAIDEVVCAGLAAIESFEFVWIGRHESGVLRPTQTAGNPGGYLDAVQPIEVDGADAAEPASRATWSGTRCTVDTVASELRKGDWQREALSANFLSVLSLPLEHRGVPYGVLTIYASETDAFGAETRDVITELADAVGETCHRVEQRRALANDDEFDVTFEVESATAPLLSMVDRFGAQLTVTRALVQPGGRCLVFGEAHADADAIESAASETPGIGAVRLIEETDDGYRCEIRITERSLPHAVVEQSGTIEEVSYEADQQRVHATFPNVESISATLTELTDRFPALTVLEQQQRPARDEDVGEARLVDTLFEELTDRQFEALEVAHQRGYFEIPRTSSGTEIAESMDVAPPTFLDHLRRAESTLLTELLRRQRER